MAKMTLSERTRAKWRKKGYFVDSAEQIIRIGRGIKRKDLFGFTDLVALDPDGRLVFLQVTTRKQVRKRLGKIRHETTGVGQHATRMCELARRLLEGGHRIIIEGWDKHDGRWRCRERELSLADLSILANDEESPDA